MKLFALKFCPSVGYNFIINLQADYDKSQLRIDCADCKKFLVDYHKWNQIQNAFCRG